MDQLFKKRNQELKEFSYWLKRNKQKKKKKYQIIFLNNVKLVTNLYHTFH